ncbi:MAG: hypothetical protein JW986_11275 [Methanotrichaceae archaeon]|nr:hypothetical protein [Methanotrichaceae archaeon]
MTVGTEHELSINDSSFHPLPIADRLIERVAGEMVSEVPFGDLFLSKELQKHAIELIPRKPAESLASLERSLFLGVERLYREFSDCKFLGLGMHPLLTLHETAPWDHQEGEYYKVYDRIFNIWQHGWLNIQAIQINFPYRGEEDLVRKFNRVRSLTPYLVAVSAASPFVEGGMNGYMDNRLRFYRENQRRIPLICNDILPERLDRTRDYVEINRRIYKDLKELDGGILCREWVNSRGVIVRFSRSCLEVKAIDEQESIRSDMAQTAFLLCLLRSDLKLEEEEDALRDALEKAIRSGTSDLKPELLALYNEAYKVAGPDERRYLPLIKERVEKGSLAEVMAEIYRDSGELGAALASAEEALRTNRPLVG